jgi:hypothetical protein
MNITSVLNLATMLHFANVPREKLECITSEGELSLRADDMAVSCVREKHAHHIGNDLYSLDKPHRSTLEVSLVSHGDFEKQRKDSAFLSLSKHERVKKRCDLVPEIQIKAKNKGEVFPEFEVKSQGKKVDCTFKSRFGEGERDLLREINGAKNFKQTVTLNDYGINQPDFPRQQLISMQGHPTPKRARKDHQKELEVQLRGSELQVNVPRRRDHKTGRFSGR